MSGEERAGPAAAQGLVFGALDPPGHYGLHWVVGMSLAGARPAFSITVAM